MNAAPAFSREAVLSDHSITFPRAVVRAVADSAVEGLRAVDRGAPDPALFRAQHADYVAALREAGCAVTELPAREAFPDSCFVEDTAICLPQGGVLMRPGAASRLGEVAEIAPALRGLCPEVRQIDPPARIEGGDVLITGREILVGRSARTDAEGVAALARTVADWGWPVREVETPPDVLHFKTDCALLAPDTVLATPRLAATGCFAGYAVVLTADGEEAAANAIRVNGLVLMADGFPHTAQAVSKAGFDVRVLGNSEAAKLDGGMSCLSLRLPEPAPPAVG